MTTEKTENGTWIGPWASRSILGIQQVTLDGRGVKNRKGRRGVEYDLADIWAKCSDLIFQNLRQTHSSLEDMESLKAEKLAQEIRKLTIDNDARDGTLVLAQDVEVTYSRSIKAIADELDGVITAIKIAIPDVPQAVLATVADKLAEARRKAARIDFGSL